MLDVLLEFEVLYANKTGCSNGINYRFVGGSFLASLKSTVYSVFDYTCCRENGMPSSTGGSRHVLEYL